MGAQHAPKACEHVRLVEELERRALGVAVTGENFHEQALLVPERIVEAASAQPRRRLEVLDRGRVEAFAPEDVGRSIERRLFVEPLHARHAPSRPRDLADHS